MSWALPGLFLLPRFASRSLKNSGLLKIDPTLFLMVAIVAADDVSDVDDDDGYWQAWRDGSGKSFDG